MTAGDHGRGRRLELCGWLLFLVCSLFFTVDAVIARSPLGTAAGALFFFGCVLFLVPRFRSRA